ncbi:unnamed protein product [Timema podura]|uniref:Major facilitator superfamily (MFS) profile domain-containing protein n=1 Tax=Timema podura TaxID=61482 RepID=A0ABN7NLP9_TIMPD|nr:unnamed protein product [Timema podura]
MDSPTGQRRISLDFQDGGLVDSKMEKFETEYEEQGSVKRQYIAATVANLAAMVAGCCMGWTSPTLPYLESTKYIILTKGEEGWISSILALSAAIGPFPAGMTANRYGHKKALLGTAAIYILSWILLTAAKGAGLMYVARFLFGLSIGATFTVVPMYVGEIAEVLIEHSYPWIKIRGALGSFTQLLCTLGFMYVYSIGPYVSYISLGVACTAVSVLFLVTMLFIPDSPYQLVKRGDREGARKALQWLRSKSSSGVNKELNELQVAVDEQASQKTSLRDLVATRGNVKALILSLGLVGWQQFSGINAVLFFSQAIFKMSGGTLDPSIATILIGVVMFLASGCTPLLVDRTGRRFLLLTSAVGMTLSQGVLGLFFFLRHIDVDTTNIGLLPVGSLIVYIIVYSIGFGPLPWAVMGELFSPKVKSTASSLTASFCWVLGFLITKFFQDIVDGLGTHSAFWMFSVCCGLAGMFVFFLLPETKGKSLQEIQLLLEK